MAVDTAIFLSGISILVGLDLAVLAISVQNARKVGHDKQARGTAEGAEEAAEEAEEQAQYAHTRLTRHLRRDHDRDVQEAADAQS